MAFRRIRKSVKWHDTFQIEIESRNNMVKMHEELESFPEGFELLRKYEESWDGKTKKLVMMIGVKNILNKKQTVINECIESNVKITRLESEISRQNNVIEDLKSSMVKMEHQVIDQDMEIQMITENKCNIVEAASKQAFQNKQNISHLQETITFLETNNACLQTSVEKYKTTVCDLESLKMRNKEHLEKLENQNRQLESENTSLKTKNETLSDELQMLKDVVKQKDIELENLSKCLSDLPTLVMVKSPDEHPESYPESHPTIPRADISDKQSQTDEPLYVKQTKEMEKDISSLTRNNNSLQEQIRQCHKDLQKLENKRSSLDEENRTLTLQMQLGEVKLDSVRKESLLMQDDKDHQVSQLIKRLETTMSNQLQLLSGQQAETHSDMTCNLEIICDVNLSTNEKIDKIISTLDGSRQEDAHVVQKLPDDVKEYCMKIQSRVGANIKVFARSLGLDPLVVEELTKHKNLNLTDVFWKVVCRCCVDLKDQFNVDSISRACDDIGVIMHEVTVMSEDHKKILTRHHSYLVENLMVTITLLFMKDSQLVSDEVSYYVKSAPAAPDRAERFLEQVTMMGDTAFDEFVLALQQSGQPHIAHRLLGVADSQTRVKQCVDTHGEMVDTERVLSEPRSSSTHCVQRHLSHDSLPDTTYNQPGADLSRNAKKQDIKQLEESIKSFIKDYTEDCLTQIFTSPEI